MVAEIKLLLIEDSIDDSELLVRHLKKAGMNPIYERVETEPHLFDALKDRDWDAVICDYNLPTLNALTAITMVKQSRPDVPFIILSGSIGEDLAVETMRAGANDYIMKDNLIRLIPALRREIKEADLRRQRKAIEEALKQSEANLRQSQKFEAIGQLAGGIAHDFNNILATILIQTEVISKSLEKAGLSHELAESTRKGVEQIRKNGARATNLTRQLLAFSRKQVLQPQVLNLNDIIAEMDNTFIGSVEENIEIKLNLKSDLRHIKIDPIQLEQVLLNLTVNSRDAMPDGGTIRIETDEYDVDSVMAQSHNVCEGPYVLLSFADSGLGMTAEVKKRIFEPFFTTKPVGKGTGLGLSTIYGIIKQNQGFIIPESEINKGTHFKIYFPVSDEARVVPLVLPVEEDSDLTGTESILLVEDEEDFRELVAEVLTKNGYKVIVAANGLEAVEKLKLQNFHLMITDVVMPQLSGAKLAKILHETNPSTQIIFQSGYAKDTLTENGTDPEKIHFIEKPYTLSILLNKVRSVLDSTYRERN